MLGFTGSCGGGAQVLTAGTLRALRVATVLRSLSVVSASCAADDDDDTACGDRASTRGGLVWTWLICATINLLALMVATRRCELSGLSRCLDSIRVAPAPCGPQHNEIWCVGEAGTKFKPVHTCFAIAVYSTSTLCFGGLIDWDLGNYFRFILGAREKKRPILTPPATRKSSISSGVPSSASTSASSVAPL